MYTIIAEYTDSFNNKCISLADTRIFTEASYAKERAAYLAKQDVNDKVFYVAALVFKYQKVPSPVQETKLV